MRDVTPMKNTGKPSENQFENCINNSYGSQAYIYRIEDAADLYAMNNGVVNNSLKPCDYVVTIKGKTMMAEVKSTISSTAFTFKCIRPNQLHAAKRMKLAGGLYIFFVHRIETDTFYMLTLDHIEAALNQGRKSIKWEDLPLWDEYENWKNGT